MACRLVSSGSCTCLQAGLVSSSYTSRSSSHLHLHYTPGKSQPSHRLSPRRCVMMPPTAGLRCALLPQEICQVGCPNATKHTVLWSRILLARSREPGSGAPVLRPSRSAGADKSWVPSRRRHDRRVGADNCCLFSFSISELGLGASQDWTVLVLSSGGEGWEGFLCRLISKRRTLLGYPSMAEAEIGCVTVSFIHAIATGAC